MADQVDPKKVREIKIKSGVVKRLAKEKGMYEKEAEEVQAKLNKMKADDPDDYMIKKQQELLEESRCMIPDCKRHLDKAWDELSKLMEDNDNLRDTEEYKVARTILEESKVACGR